MEVNIECHEPAIINALEKEGFALTFGDVSGNAPFFMIEDGKGQWVMFVIVNGKFCQLGAGSFGVHTKLPPNL